VSNRDAQNVDWKSLISSIWFSAMTAIVVSINVAGRCMRTTQKIPVDTDLVANLLVLMCTYG
jgi:hypothetical protein